MFRTLSCYLFHRLIVALIPVLYIVPSAMATTAESGMVSQFAVSPDGERILFISQAEVGETSPNSASAMLLDFRTMDPIGLTGDIEEAALSPDGNFIAYIQDDAHYRNALFLLTADGKNLKIHYHQRHRRFSQLRWSEKSVYGYEYLSFMHQELAGEKQTAIISPQFGMLLDEVNEAKWHESEQVPADHPIYQKKPDVRPESSIVWGDNSTFYLQAADGIWRGELDQPFLVQWTHLVPVDDINMSQNIGISPQRTHLLYSRSAERSWESAICLLSLDDDAKPVQVGIGIRPQFTPDGNHMLMVHLGLWMVSLDGSSKHRLTRQISYP